MWEVEQGYLSSWPERIENKDENTEKFSKSNDTEKFALFNMVQTYLPHFGYCIGRLEVSFCLWCSWQDYYLKYMFHPCQCSHICSNLRIECIPSCVNDLSYWHTWWMSFSIEVAIYLLFFIACFIRLYWWSALFKQTKN